MTKGHLLKDHGAIVMKKNILKRMRFISSHMNQMRYSYENDSLASKLAKFENSSYYLKEMLENQRSPNDIKGLGFTDCKDSTSEVKQAKIVEKADKKPFDVANPFKRDLDSTNEGI
ncbi:hypothetical protein Tco_0674388 [Tanacetum coccineum]